MSMVNNDLISKYGGSISCNGQSIEAYIDEVVQDSKGFETVLIFLHPKDTPKPSNTYTIYGNNFIVDSYVTHHDKDTNRVNHHEVKLKRVAEIVSLEVPPPVPSSKPYPILALPLDLSEEANFNNTCTYGYVRDNHEFRINEYEIKTLNGIELMESVNLSMGVTHRIRIKYRDDVGVGLMLAFNKKSFKVERIENINEANIALILYCRVNSNDNMI